MTDQAGGGLVLHLPCHHQAGCDAERAEEHLKKGALTCTEEEELSDETDLVPGDLGEDHPQAPAGQALVQVIVPEVTQHSGRQTEGG